jgi:RNA polymerase sigma-70 factor (ECF subfamily)
MVQLLARFASVAPSGEAGVAVPPLDFDGIYDEHMDFVWRTARRLGVAEWAADDVVQQVFLTVHRRLATFEGRSSVRTWIFAILRRCVQEHRRLLRRRTPHLVGGGTHLDPDSLPAPAGDKERSQAEAARIVERLLESLSDDERTIFVLAELEQLPMREIAEGLGLKLKTAYSRARTARIQFERAAARMRLQEDWRTR